MRYCYRRMERNLTIELFKGYNMIKRTSKKDINRMLKEIRIACGLKTNAQALEHYNKAYTFIYNHSGATLSIYMNGDYTISKTTEGACFDWQYVSLEDWLDSPSKLIAVWKDA